MNIPTKRQRRPNRSAADWARTISEWRASGQTARAFARERNVGESSLHRWAGRLDARPSERQDRKGVSRTRVRSATKKEPRLLRIEVPSSVGSSGEGGRCPTIEVELRSGHVVRVPGGLSASALAEVFRALEMVTLC